MADEFEYTSPEEEALLRLIRNLSDQNKAPSAWMLHPVNYPRAVRAAERILSVLKKESSTLKHEFVFDSLVGTGMSLVVKDWTFAFYGCREFSVAVSFADTFDIDATVEGEVALCFGFLDVRIPIVL